MAKSNMKYRGMQRPGEGRPGLTNPFRSGYQGEAPKANTYFSDTDSRIARVEELLGEEQLRSAHVAREGAALGNRAMADQIDEARVVRRDQARDREDNRRRKDMIAPAVDQAIVSRMYGDDYGDLRLEPGMRSDGGRNTIGGEAFDLLAPEAPTSGPRPNAGSRIGENVIESYIDNILGIVTPPSVAAAREQRITAQMNNEARAGLQREKIAGQTERDKFGAALDARLKTYELQTRSESQARELTARDVQQQQQQIAAEREQLMRERRELTLDSPRLHEARIAEINGQLADLESEGADLGSALNDVLRRPMRADLDVLAPYLSYEPRDPNVLQTPDEAARIMRQQGIQADPMGGSGRMQYQPQAGLADASFDLNEIPESFFIQAEAAARAAGQPAPDTRDVIDFWNSLTPAERQEAINSGR